MPARILCVAIGTPYYNVPTDVKFTFVMRPVTLQLLRVQSQWLTYWTLYGSLILAEHVADQVRDLWDSCATWNEGWRLRASIMSVCQCAVSEGSHGRLLVGYSTQLLICRVSP